MEAAPLFMSRYRCRRPKFSCHGASSAGTLSPMKRRSRILAGVLPIAALVLSCGQGATGAQDPLPSWNDTSPKKSIVAFVERVTKEGSPDFVPVPERIATFDNDGTLWSEKPVPFQLLFAFDQVKALAPQHPEWKTKQPFAALLKGDMEGVAATGEKGVIEILTVTHTGMTTDEFSRTVQDWIVSARHPKTGRLYTEMVYQPMLELLAYLRASGFKTFIVSGGGVEFMRPWTERVYGIPPEQVVGSAGKLKLETRDGRPVLVKLPEVDLIDDKDGEAGRDPEPDRAAADRRVRQLRRRPSDAGMGHGRSGCALRPFRPPRRLGARVRVRPSGQAAAVRQGVGRGRGQGVDRGEHEGRLEDRISRLLTS